MRVWEKSSVVLAVVALGLTGCGSGSAAPGETTEFKKESSGTLNAWAFDNADDVGKARMKYAAEQLGDVKITMDQTPFDAQKFTTRAASGDVPDVVQMDRAFVATYAAKGLIKPLDWMP